MAMSAVPESNDSDLNWEGTANVADREGLEGHFGGRRSRTW